MSEINSDSQHSIQQFIEEIYTASNKTIIFWDTCSLLEIYRFPYRNGSVNSFKILDKINQLIQNEDIFSVASSLTITEWNDNEAKIKQDFQNSLEKTNLYHSTCLDISNEIFATTHVSVSIHDKGLIQTFETLADNIISKTIFIRTEEIANSALERVRDKRPPASKKQEFKDCTVWETILKLSQDIYTFDKDNRQIFYTVNTDDFVDKSREPRRFHNSLITEASLSNLSCCVNLDEVSARM